MSVHIKACWKNLNKETGDKIIKFWQGNKVPFTEEKLRQRLEQVVLVVEFEGKIIGVSTAALAHVKRLDNSLYGIRLMLDPSYRIPGLTSKLTTQTIEFLEKYVEENSINAVGVMTVVENEGIKQHRREAIWPSTKMLFIGTNQRGDHIRLRYFKGAKI